MEKNQRYQKINQVFMVLYLLVCLWGIVDSFLHSTPYYMGLSLLSPLFLLIPPLFWRITRLKPAYLVSLTVNLFSFLAFVIGIAFRGYGRLAFAVIAPYGKQNKQRSDQADDHILHRVVDTGGQHMLGIGMKDKVHRIFP